MMQKHSSPSCSRFSSFQIQMNRIAVSDSFDPDPNSYQMVLFLVTMNCIVSIHYADSNFELDQCDVHRKKRHYDEDEKELEYKVEYKVVENSAIATCSCIGLFLAIIQVLF